jgi:N-methylhydantoinase A
MGLDEKAAERALELHVGQPLGLDPVESAAAVLEVMTEQMVQAIEEITVRQGVAPGEAVLVAGGGSSGFNCVGIARRLGCPLVIVPEVAAGLSAAGALLSELSSEVQMTHPTSTANFDFAGVTAVLRLLEARAAAFLNGPGAGSLSTSVEFFAEARYPDQVWELEVPVSRPVFESQDDIDRLRASFHDVHRETFAVADEAAQVEVVTWGTRVRCRLRPEVEREAAQSPEARSEVGRRLAYFDGKQVECKVYSEHAVASRCPIAGPALIQSPSATVVIPANCSLVRTEGESLRISPWIRTDVPLAR